MTWAARIGHFLKTFGRDALPDGATLAALIGGFQFIVHCYDDDPHELYATPEIRRFYQHFQCVWP